MPRRFCSVSFKNGKIGVSHTTVGIPFACMIFSTSYRRLVVQTWGSKMRQSVSFHVVNVICTTHFAFC